MATGFPCYRTEALLGRGYDWGNVSKAVAAWLAKPGPWIIEGLLVPRAIRKWIELQGTPVPVDRVYWLGTVPRDALLPGQQALAKGVETVWLQCEPVLREQGVISRAARPEGEWRVERNAKQEPPHVAGLPTTEHHDQTDSGPTIPGLAKTRG